MHVHTSVQSTAEIHNCGFELVPHPAYSPDLPRPNLKKHFKGMKFSSNQKVQVPVNEYFESLKGSFFKRGITALKPDEKNASSDVVIMLKSKNTFVKVCIYFHDQAANFPIHPRIALFLTVNTMFQTKKTLSVYLNPGIYFF